ECVVFLPRVPPSPRMARSHASPLSGATKVRSMKHSTRLMAAEVARVVSLDDRSSDTALGALQQARLEAFACLMMCLGRAFTRCEDPVCCAGCRRDGSSASVAHQCNAVARGCAPRPYRLPGNRAGGATARLMGDRSHEPGHREPDRVRAWTDEDDRRKARVWQFHLRLDVGIPCRRSWHGPGENPREGLKAHDSAEGRNRIRAAVRSGREHEAPDVYAQPAISAQLAMCGAERPG